MDSQNGKHVNVIDHNTHYDGYQYAHHTFDHNSIAQYNPSVYTTNADDHSQQDYPNVTYGNVILGVYTEDPSHAYILSSTESRLFNTYVRSNNEIDQMNGYTDQLITEDINGHHQHLEQHHQSELLHDDSGAIYNEYVDSSIVHNDEIIVQADGQFYRQIQNVYVNGEDTAQVEFFPMIADYFAEHDTTQINETQQQYYQQYQLAGASFEQQQQEQCTIDQHSTKHMNEVILLPPNSTNTDGLECHVELVTNNQYYKNEYTVLEPMNRQMIQRHSEQQQELTAGIRPVTMDEKEQQRLLLESTMSPLLAAVNDITSRDEQLQLYLAQHEIDQHDHVYHDENNADQTFVNSSDSAMVDVKENIIPTAETPTTAITTQNSVVELETHQSLVDSSTNDTVPIENYHLTASTNISDNNNKLSTLNSSEYVDINEFVVNRSQHYNGMIMNSDRTQEKMLQRRSQRKIPKNDELLVSDKHVPCRAWATLPTTYLSIGKSLDNPLEHAIYAKKDIPLRTKFGPLQGDTKTYTLNEIDTMKAEKMRTVPLLLISDTNVIDVSNEYTSNWMRFVRLAKTYTEQNLELGQHNNELYYKSCQSIGPKQELKVGYSVEYARTYNLPLLEPNSDELSAIYEKTHQWPCYECEQKFVSFDELQLHLNIHDNERINDANATAITVPRGADISASCFGLVRKQRRRKRNTRRFRLSQRKISGPTVRYACCYCSEVFPKFSNLKRHNEAVHSFVDAEARNGSLSSTSSSSSVLTNSNRQNANKSLKCDICMRYFSTAERLKDHRNLHTTSLTLDPKLVECTFCSERMLTPAALAMHMKSHTHKNKMFICIFCLKSFRVATELNLHVPTHMCSETSAYNCPHCQKKFKEYTLLRHHVKSYHNHTKHPCPECGRTFKSRTKLKHHRLSHSDVREFLCDDCGKQFKRKDKLREHIMNTHSPEARKKKEAAQTAAARLAATRKSSTLSETNDYHRFLYKCHDCRLGFKRRGMLVNHMIKRHPTVNVDTVPELSMPILQAQRFYYCQYCDKVYKSSGKRKLHILKNHPGLELPQPARRKKQVVDSSKGVDNVAAAGSGNEIDSTFSEMVGNVTTLPQRCDWCPKQYATKARLVQHQRKEHNEELLKQQSRPKPSNSLTSSMILPSNLYSTSSFDECDNNLLRLSSAAMEASLQDDFEYFNGQVELLSSEYETKIDGTYKVINGNGIGLTRLPSQLFDDNLDYNNVTDQSNTD